MANTIINKKGRPKGIDCSRILYYMRKKRIIAQELADMIKTNPSHICLILNNKRPNISLRTAWDIADALEMPITELFIKK